MSSYKIRKTPGNLSWFIHSRFGMFIHFGLYTLPARHEWIKNMESISDEDYDKYFNCFNPDLFEPDKWAKQAKAAGMKYVVLTTKHHEGFCLWNTKYTDYNVMNTPYGKDLLREFVDAFRAEGFHIGFYYSLLDWHHPDFNIDVIHPRHNDQNAVELNHSKNMKKYAEYMRNQVTELLTNYGKIDILWFDYSYSDQKSKIDSSMNGKGKDDWEAEKLLETARKIQPEIIINNRTEIEQDIWTPEQIAVNEWVKDQEGNLVPWEACHTFSGSWGYHRDEVTWKTPNQLIDLLVRTVSHGGNLIMNVGPTSRGYFDCRAESALQVYADWLHYNGRSIYGCTQAEPEILKSCPENCLYTQSEDGKRLYIHLLSYPYDNIEIKGISDKVYYVQYLSDGSEIKYQILNDAVNLQLNKVRSDYQVIEIILRQ